jgi:hypothetical protein
MGYFNERREPRPCKKCGFVRVVKIVDRTEFVPDGTTTRVNGSPSQGGEFKFVGESYAETCRGCHLEANARKYDRLADENRRRAKVERERQKNAKTKET